MKPYQLPVDLIAKTYETDFIHGLSTNQATERLKRYGLNLIPEKPIEPWIQVFIRQFKNPLIYILLAAATIIFFIGPDKVDAFIITGILLFNAIIGTIQEGKTRTILHSLKRFVKDSSVVLRDGKKTVIEDSLLVVGDIVLLQEGRRVPADARIIESNNLHVDQAMLTGESTRVLKTTAPLMGDISPADQTNMVFRQTYIIAGSGKAVVVATGLQTEIGQIHQLIEEMEVVAPLQKELENLSHWILLFIFALCFILFLIGFVTGKPINELLVVLTALFICIIPEGLPVVLSLVLVSGMYRMAKKNVLVKNMQAAEAFGRTNVIVIDKTGTLTRNEMMVSQVSVNGKKWHISGAGYDESGTVSYENIPRKSTDPIDSLSMIGIAAALLNSAEITKRPDGNLFDIKGDPTEAAMYIVSKKLGLSRANLETEYKKIYEIPFDSQYKYHALFCTKNDQTYAFIAGAPEIVFAHATVQSKQQNQLNLEDMLKEGLRTIAVAIKQFKAPLIETDHNLAYYQKLIADDLEILGICGLEDTIRHEVADIIMQARQAGLSIIMATGDHKETALFVAKKTGIFRDGDMVIEGPELDKLSDVELLAILDKISVFARVSPQHKLRIINTFHKKEVLIAMTGDGVNDAPSLVAADIGIAMGLIGTEVAKESADIILLDDSFASIIKAIEQGRHIFYTLKKVILYFFSTNMGEVLIVSFALLAGLPLPITAAQILWLNLITDGFLNTALSTEPQESGLLKKISIENQIHLVDLAMVAKMIFTAIPMALGSLLIFYHYYKIDLALARTLTLVTMALFQWFNAWNCRSNQKSLLQIGLLKNRWLTLTTIFVFFLQLLLVYLPVMQKIFKTVPLTFHQWLLALATSSSIIGIEEARKFFVRRLYPE